jgi:hypothetical protein
VAETPDKVSEENELETYMEHFYSNCGALHRIKWHRIILGGMSGNGILISEAKQVLEAHEIRNRTGKTSIAVRMLSASKRRILTGTPLLK